MKFLVDVCADASVTIQVNVSEKVVALIYAKANLQKPSDD